MIEDGIILKGTRIVIPAKICKAVSKLIHEGHFRPEQVQAACKRNCLLART